jgi:hypothetical protein
MAAPKRIDDEVRRALRAAAEPSTPIDVIVTFTPGTALAAFESAGLQVSRAYEATSAVAGRIAARDLPRLAEVKGVERIEADATAQAL